MLVTACTVCAATRREVGPRGRDRERLGRWTAPSAAAAETAGGAGGPAGRASACSADRRRPVRTRPATKLSGDEQSEKDETADRHWSHVRARTSGGLTAAARRPQVTSIRRGTALGAFGIVIVSTPSCRSALMRSASTADGSAKRRRNGPCPRSTRWYCSQGTRGDGPLPLELQLPVEEPDLEVVTREPRQLGREHVAIDRLVQVDGRRPAGVAGLGRAGRSAPGGPADRARDPSV